MILGHRSRSTLPPARVCHALRCLVNFFWGGGELPEF